MLPPTSQVSVRDSGKTQVDAMIGEVLTTCEKLAWTIANGEKYLKDEPRDVGALMLMKKVWSLTLFFVVGTAWTVFGCLRVLIPFARPPERPQPVCFKK